MPDSSSRPRRVIPEPDQTPETVPARAAPEPSADDVAGQLRDLSREAENLTEDFKKAQDDRSTRRADLDRADAEVKEAEQRVAAANAEQEKFRGRVDRFTEASYEGARLSRLSALLASESPTDYPNYEYIGDVHWVRRVAG